MITGLSTCMKWAAIIAAAATLITGCGKKDDPIAKSEEKKDVGVTGLTIISSGLPGEESLSLCRPCMDRTLDYITPPLRRNRRTAF